MAKNEELISLMTEEIADFKKSVDKLFETNQNLSQIKIKPDLRDITSLMEGKIVEQNIMQKKFLNQLQLIENKQKKTREFQKWITISKLSLVFQILLIVSYSLYKISSITQIEEVAFKSGQEQVLKHLRTFLNENEEASKIYDDWQTNTN